MTYVIYEIYVTLFLNKVHMNMFTAFVCNLDYTRHNNPGIILLKNFMKRNRLSHKKVEMISAARKTNTSNPFIMALRATC